MAGKTLLAVSSLEKEIAEKEGTKTDKAIMVGKLTAEKSFSCRNYICCIRQKWLFIPRKS